MSLNLGPKLIQLITSPVTLAMGTAERGGHNLLSVPQKDGGQEMRLLETFPFRFMLFYSPITKAHTAFSARW